MRWPMFKYEGRWYWNNRYGVFKLTRRILNSEIDMPDPIDADEAFEAFGWTEEDTLKRMNPEGGSYAD